MSTRTFSRFSSSRQLVRRGVYALGLATAVAAAPSGVARAQSVPLPFAGTFAGGGTVCAASLPVFAVTGTGAKYGDGCPATQATLNVPVGIATDALGNVFIADQTHQLVRVVYNQGTALATAIAASNVQNMGLAPVKGNIYTIAGGITATPTETTKYCNQAGSGTVGTDTPLDGCPGSETEQGPRGIAVDGDGNVFISSVSPVSQIRVFYVGGTAAAKLITLMNPTITTPLPGYVYNLAGANSSAYTGDGASAVKASINTPRGLFIDASENIYFADQLNNAVRRVDSGTGFISTVAGYCVASGTTCTATATSGDGSIATSSAVNIDGPYGVTIDRYGNLFIAEAGNGGTVPGRVRVVYAGGTLPGITNPTVGNIYTYAGGASGTTAAQLATFQEVFGVSLDRQGYLYVTDYRSGTTGSNRIARVDPVTGSIATVAGNFGTALLTTGAYCNGGTTGPVTTDTFGDGCPATQAYLQNPQEGVAFDGRGNFYVADRVNNLVRSFTYNNLFPATAVGASVTQPLAFLYAAGTPATETFTTQGSATSDYSDGGGDTCALNTAITVATTCVDYVKFTPTAAGARPGSITVSSATATVGTEAVFGIGNASVLTLDPGTAVGIGAGLQPTSVSADRIGNVYITDAKGKQVLRSTIAGGTPTAVITALGTPQETTTDSYGDVFVVDSTNNNVVEHTAAGATATFGTGLSAPQGIVADPLGNVYVADTGNNRLVYISPLTGSQTVVFTSGFTLSAPTYLAMDAAGDLFLIDTANTRVLEIPLGGIPQTVTLPAGTVPVAITFDPGGDTYIADKTTGAILLLPYGGTTATTLVPGLTTPAGVAVSPSGNVFVADSAATSVAGYNRAVNTTVFATTNINQTGLANTLTLGSAGTLSATLATPPYTETGTAAAFPATTPSTCAGGLVLAAGASCTQSFTFKPTTAGPQSAQVVFATTTGQTAAANFSATATNLITTTTTLTLQGNGLVNYGQMATYTVTLTPASNAAAAPTGNIAFLVDGVKQSSQNVGTGPYTFTATLAIGTHTIAAVYSGDNFYAGSNASTVLTVGKATTTTTASFTQSASGLVLSAVVTPTSTGAATFTGNVLFYIDGAVAATMPVGNGTVTATALVADGTHSYYAMYVGDANYASSTSMTQSVTVARTPTVLTLTVAPVSNSGVSGFLLSAKLTYTSTATPTGTITFSNGSAVLGVVNLSTAVNGIVTFMTSTVSYTNYSFTAAYSGDGLFQPQTATVTEGADFVLVAPTTVLGVPQGGQAVTSVVVSPINGYSGTLTASCSNLPTNAICRFLPSPLVLTATAPVTLQVQVFAGVNPNVATNVSPALRHSSETVLALLILSPLAFGLRRRRGVPRRVLPVLIALGMLVAMPALNGCAGGTPAASGTVYVTPAGTSVVTVTLTDTNKVARSATFTINVSN